MDNLSAVLQRVAKVAADVSAPQAASVDREGRWPEESLRALQAAGLGGLVVPEELGGLGVGLLGVVSATEELGRACASTALCFGMHCVGSAVIAAKATADQEARLLRPICEGRHLTSLALSEPGTGAHFYIPQAELAPAGPGAYEVRGTKAFVTSGGRADSYVLSVAARSPDAAGGAAGADPAGGAPLGEFSCILVPGDAPGLAWGPPWEGLGMRGNSSRTLELHGVPVPRANLLGEEGDEIWYVFHVVAPYFLSAMAGTYLGIAGAALAEARAHLRERTYAHHAGSIASLPVLQHRLGTLWAQLERARRLAYWAAAEADAGGEEALPALFSAKAEAADCAVAVVNDAMTLLGGIAYRDGAPMERHLRDARAAPVMAPTTDMLRTWTGRALLDLPIVGD